MKIYSVIINLILISLLSFNKITTPTVGLIEATPQLISMNGSFVSNKVKIEEIIEKQKVEKKYQDDQVLGELTTLLNQYRQISFKESKMLNEQACRRAKYMHDNGVWSHDGWESWFDRLIWDKSIGENLAKFPNNTDNNTKVIAWMNSLTHMLNIINENYHYHGSCTYEDITVSLFAG